MEPKALTADGWSMGPMDDPPVGNSPPTTADVWRGVPRGVPVEQATKSDTIKDLVNETMKDLVRDGAAASVKAMLRSCPQGGGGPVKEPVCPSCGTVSDCNAPGCPHVLQPHVVGG